MLDEAPRDLAKCRVLVVEDEYLIAADLASWLEDHGAEVLGPVASVDDALELINIDLRPNVALLDVNLGDEQVFPVARALQLADVPFVFTSGYDDCLIPAQYDDAPRCIKPLDRSRLLRTLAGVLHN